MKEKNKVRMAFYMRVSTEDQTTAHQLPMLERWAEYADLTDRLHEVYVDEAWSGKHQGRPALRQLEDAIKRREVNLVVVTKLDRLGRSLAHLSRLVCDMRELGCDLVVLGMNGRSPIDTGTAEGKMFFHMCAAFAEFESDIISERTKAALATAKKRGKKLGTHTHKGRSRALPNSMIVRIEELLKQHTPEREIMSRLGVSSSSVHKARVRLREEANGKVAANA